MNRKHPHVSVLILSLIPTLAHAADKPTGLLSQAPVTSGTTNVTAEGFDKAAKPAEGKDASEASIGAGGNLAVGNSNSLAVSAFGTARLRRGSHQAKFAASINNTSSPRPDDITYVSGQDAQGNDVTTTVTEESRDADWEATVNNYQGMLRYDYFITQTVSGFLKASGSHDGILGYDLRLSLDPGVAIYIVDTEKEQLSLDVGYDFQHDIRTDEKLAELQAAGTPAEQVESRHQARLALDYHNQLNEGVGVSFGVEYLQAFGSKFTDEATDRVNWQLNSVTTLSSKLSDSFFLNASLGVKHDNNPLGLNQSNDVQTAINLVYTLL